MLFLTLFSDLINYSCSKSKKLILYFFTVRFIFRVDYMQILVSFLSAQAGEHRLEPPVVCKDVCKLVEVIKLFFLLDIGIGLRNNRNQKVEHHQGKDETLEEEHNI